MSASKKRRCVPQVPQTEDEDAWRAWAETWVSWDPNPTTRKELQSILESFFFFFVVHFCRGTRVHMLQRYRLMLSCAKMTVNKYVSRDSCVSFFDRFGASYNTLPGSLGIRLGPQKTVEAWLGLWGETCRYTTGW